MGVMRLLPVILRTLSKRAQYSTQAAIISNPRGRSRQIRIGDMDIVPWTTAGMESCVVVSLSIGQSKKLHLAFDMGYACQQSVKCNHVFISHGHMDHCSAMHQHASKRSLMRNSHAKYYLGSELVRPMETIQENLNQISEFPFQADWTVTNPNDVVQLPGPYHVVPFKTFHRVPSMGFLLYKTTSEVKEEFSKYSRSELKQMELRGEQVYNEVVSPELAYTGDTTFEVFTPPSIPDLLKVKVLITECTYINTVKNINEALTRERGHIHLHEIIRNQHIFSDVQALMLVHFSERYKAENIFHTINKLCPTELKGKLYSACVDKEETHIASY